MTVSIPGLLSCASYPVRAEPPTPLEYVAAELFVRNQFDPAFRGRYPVASAVTWQLDFLTTEYAAERHAPPVAAILRYMRSDFANPLSTGRMRQFAQAYRDDTLTQALISDMITFVGGFRKPDMCGITADVDPARIELVEVGTVKTRDGTRKELEQKITQLQTQVVPLAMAELRAQAVRDTRSPPVSGIQVLASPWRPQIRVCPLPVPVTDGAPTSYEWICYEPTFADSSGSGEAGLVIYHIHKVDSSALGKQVPVILAVGDALKRWRAQQRTGPRLLPLLQPVWTEQPAFDRDTLQVLAHAAVGVMGVLAVALGVAVVPLLLDASLVAASPAGAALATWVAGLADLAAISSSSSEAGGVLAGFAQAALAGNR